MRTKNPCQIRSLLITGLVLWFFNANVVNADATCRKGCPQSDTGILQYKPGNVYEYNFDSILTVGLTSGAAGESDDTNLKIAGTAKVFAEGNCGYTLQLNAVKITTTKDNVVKKILQSIQKPVHFTLVNGKVQPELCADVAENAYALNIKRAVISLLQSSIESDSEVDVFGQCPTHTTVSKVGNAEIVSKVRDLNACAYREQINSGLVSGVVNSKAGIKSTHLFKADYSKETKVERGVVESAQLVEEYKFAGAPNGGAEVRAKVATTLKLKNAAGTAASAPNTGTHGVSIIFQKPESISAKNIAALKTALTETVQLVSDYVKENSAKSFVELIRLMRNADTDTLLELAASPHPNKVLARKVYLDALFRTATADSARATIKQLNKMEEKEKIIATLSLNLVKTVDRETLNLAASLLSGTANKEAYLAVGSIVAKYCERKGCEQSDVETISKKFTDSLKHCKANTKKDEERIVYVLKSIENTHHLAKSAATTLAECAATGRSNRIRVAALQAFSAASCDSTLKKKAVDLLRDYNEDAELRINAYLAAISCPTAELANEIAEIVNSETVYQVGGFITSNLKAIRDSTDDTRENQRHYLGNIRVTKHFPKDVRRYSFNNELSYKFDALGVSASADYKLIYSQHGFLPRSARLNVSTEVFGTNFNVFEASIRQENIENVLEYYVGPKGLLNKDFEDIMKVIEVGGTAEAGSRARRSIADDTAKFAKKYKTYGTKNADDLNLDLSLKLFGSELMFLSLGDNIPNTLDDIIKYFSTAFEKIKTELSSFNKEYVQHTLFLDTNVLYPTGVGVPLEFSTQGFAANKLDLGLTVDVDAIIAQNWQHAKYRLKVVPSVDVNVNVQLGFNAYVVSTGIRVVSTLHSAGGSDLNLALINDGNGFNVDIELPREKIDLIDLQVSTDFYIAEQDKKNNFIPLKGDSKRNQEQTNMCFNQLEAVGINFCFSSTIPEPTKANLREGLTLHRPFSLTMYITSERKFNIQGYHVPHTATESQQWKLDFKTPGSKESHDTSVAFELGTKPQTFARVSFDNPQYHFGLEAGVNNDDKELVLYAQYEQNNEIKKNKVGFVKNGNEYRPIIEVQDKNGVTNDINGYRADGKVVVQKTGDKQSRYNFENFQITNGDDKRVVVNGWADVGPASFISELRIAPGDQSYLIKNTLRLENSEYVVGLFVNDEKTPDNIFGGSAQIKIGQQEVDVQLVGKAANWEIDLAHDLQYVMPEGSNAITSSKFKNEVAIKNKNNLVGSFKLVGFSEGHSKFQAEAELTRGKKLAALAIKFSGSQRSQNDYILEVNGKFNKHTVDLLSKCDVNGNHFIIDNALTTSWGTSLTAKGELGQRYTPQDVYIDLQGSAQFSGKDKPTQWILKVIGAPEKTNSEFKLVSDNNELVKYNGEVQHPLDKVTAGKVNLLVKNVLTAKADFKVAKNGKGDVNVIIETQKSDQKHKIEVNSKFHVQAPKYDIETTLVLDSNKKLYFKTENTLDKLKLTSKNNAEVADKKISLDINGLVKGDWRANGEIQGNFVFTCPEGRIIDGSLKRKLATNVKSGVGQGNLEAQLNDQLSNGGKKRSIAATLKVDKLNWKLKELAQDGHIVYTNFDEKKLDINVHVKHLPKAQNKYLDIGFTANGDFLSVPIEIAVAADEYSTKHAIVRITGKYGDLLNGNINGNYHLEEKSSPTTFELQGSLAVPKSTFKTIDIKSNGKFLKPENEDSSNYVIELHLDEKTGDNQFVKFDTVLKGSRLEGAYSVDLDSQKLQGPLKLAGSYQRDQQGSIEDGTASGKQKYVFNFNYADKFAKTAADVSYAGSDTASVHYTLDSSLESAKDIDVKVRVQKIEAESYAIKVEAKQASNAYTLDSKVFKALNKKGLDLRVTLPARKPVVIVGILEQFGERKAKLTVDIENLAELDIKANAEASYKAVEDFYIIAQWNSAKLKLNGFDLDVRSQGKSINLNLKNAEGAIVSGSATYALKKEKNKAIIEGQGQAQYKGKSHNSNFRLIRQIYDLTADKEVGFSYTFNGNFGPKNGVSTLKITNKDFNVKFSVCEEKKQCTNVQLQSIVTADAREIDTMQHSILVLLDLRELGYPYEFEFQSKTTRQGLKFQYSLDSNIVSNNNMKYQLVANVVPTSSKLQLKLPNREILFESTQTYPEQGKFFGHYENSASFYFDKTNKPNDVTRFISSVDLTGAESVAINAKGEVRLEHPSIRTLTVTGKFDANRQQQIVNTEVVLDIFRLPEQKVIASSRFQNNEIGKGFNITSNQLLHSNGLGFKYELNGHTALNIEQQELSAGAAIESGASDLKASAYVFGNKERFEVVVHGLNEQIVQIVGEFNRQKYSAKTDTKLQIFGQKAIEITTELQPTLAKIAIKRADTINANAEIKLGKELKFSVDGANKKLLDGRIALDATNFLQTTYKSNEDDIKNFLETVEAEVQQENEIAREKLRNRFQKIREVIDRQVQLAKDSTPDLSKLKESYQASVNEIVRELESDPSLKQITISYRKLYAKLAKIANEVSKIVAETYENLHKTFIALYEKLQIALKDTILPAWEEFLVSATNITGELRVEVINIVTRTFQSILTVLEKYGPAVKNYGKAINESIKPINEAVQELVKVSAHAIEEFITELKECLAKLPTFDALQAQFKEKLLKLKLVERTLELLNHLFDQLNVLPQTPDTTTFLEKVHEYIEAKLKQEQVNDEKLITDLVKLLVKALRSVWENIELNSPAGGAASLYSNRLTDLFSSLPSSLNIISKLPALLTIRFSAINFVLNENWKSVLSKDNLRSWIFFQEFELKGHVADGRHIFTFDGQHIAFPGSCKYILAQDSVDNNFTVVAQLNNGKLKSIILSDRDGGFVEINDVGNLKLNGNAAEFPQHEAGIHAWRRFYTVWLRSEYGVGIVCTTDLKICHIEVNGFYTSKTRGLLGNGNAEPNDDLVQADGTIASDLSSFGNSFGLGKCNPVPKSEQKDVKHTEICSELFGIDSTLAIHYLFLNPTPYREACDAAVAAAGEKDKENAACNLATAYGSALKLRHKFVVLPLRCLKCVGAANQRELGQDFTVKIPNNKADVVFVVDIGVSPVVLNLIAPAITEVREALKTRGFTDVQIAVIAYNESQRYPALLTSDNGKINYNGNIAELQLNGPKNYCDNCITQIINEKKLIGIYEVLERIVKSIVPQSDEIAYQMALDYPFRAAAAKSIIGVRSNTLEYGNLLKLLRTQLTGAVSKFDGALLHVIEPIKGLSLEGVPTEKLVGFNSRLVATLDGKDPKKRQKLQFENNVGIDFVLNNGGWVFATQNLESLKPQDQKKALNQVTNSIADSLFKTEIVSDCACVPVHGLHAQHKCIVKSSTFVPNKKVKAA